MPLCCLVHATSELQQFGFIEGQNLTIDVRSYGEHIELLSKYAEELFATPANVIIAAGDPAIRAAQQATETTPILAFTDDMVRSGFVSSLAKPGGNTTGKLSDDRTRWQATGNFNRSSARTSPHGGTGRYQYNCAAATRSTARCGTHTRGIELSIHRVTKADEIAPAIDAAKKLEVGALNVLASPLLFANRRLIIERTAALRLPAIYQWPEMAEEGGFLAYGPRLVPLYRDIMARQLVKLLRGSSGQSPRRAAHQV